MTELNEDLDICDVCGDTAEICADAGECPIRRY
jgi:hypothetical protein